MRDTHLFTLSRPGRAAVPCKFRIGPLGSRSPPTLRGPGCRLRFLLRSRVGAAAAAASTSDGRGSPRLRSLGLAAEGLRQEASSARPRPRRSAARMLQCGALAPPPGHRSALLLRYCLPRRRAWNSLLRAALESGFPFPLLGSRPLGPRSRTSFLG